MSNRHVIQRVEEEGYVIVCPFCGSQYTGDGVDNCKHCGGPVDFRKQTDTLVYHYGESTPMVITRLDNPDPMTPGVEFRATKMIEGKKYSAMVRVPEWILVTHADYRRYIVENFKRQMAMTMAEEMEILYGGNL